MLRKLRAWRRAFLQYAPSIEILIHEQRLLHNLHEYQRAYPDALIAPVLKSNAYGHGLHEIANILDDEQIAFFAVDSLFEAMQLRHYGIKSPLLVIGYTSVENIIGSKLKNTAFTMTSLEQVIELSRRLHHPTAIHLKVDTGMHRQGVLPSEMDEALRVIAQNPYVRLEGLCSHFANADATDPSFTQAQLRTWREVKGRVQVAHPHLPYLHIAATTGAFHATAEDSNIVRLGIGLFGINPSARLALGLQPVLEMRTVIGSLKEVQAEVSVGYSMTYTTTKPTRLATIPIGYFEGLDRRLSNQGQVRVGEVLCPIVGRISMNITTIDVSHVPDIKIGDRVTVICHDPHDPCSVEQQARMAGTIPYELLVHLPQHLRRVVVSREE